MVRDGFISAENVPVAIRSRSPCGYLEFVFASMGLCRRFLFLRTHPAASGSRASRVSRAPLGKRRGILTFCKLSTAVAHCVHTGPARAYFELELHPASGLAHPRCPAPGDSLSQSAASTGSPVRVLLLEDDQRLASFLSRAFEEEGFVVDHCARGVDAIEHARAGLYDLVVLDWLVPDVDGLAVCRDIRQSGARVPVLMLTARGEVRERVLGLEAGADDYMVKPFEVDELLARVRALLRRTSGFAALRCGDLEVDRVAHQARAAGMPLLLTNREYALLLHLIHKADRIVRRSELLAQVWGLDFDPGTNLVDVHVSRVREKLAERSWMIETVRGVGYRLRHERAA